MAPAAVLFDLDGTLVDSERENVESVVLAARRLGAELTAAERDFIVGHSWNEIYEMIARNHRLTVSMDELIASAVDEKRALMATSGYRALPAAVATVRRLQRSSKLAVVSGASCVEVRDAVAGIGLTDAFSLLLGAQDYSRGKPDPEPYLMAMERLNVPANRSLVVEDAAPGIAAGHAAGARVVAVRVGNFIGSDLSGADAIIDTLEQLTDELCHRLTS